MHLILEVIGEQAEPLGRNARQAFGPEGGSLGRGLGCNWQLPDRTNTLSARHALIAFDGIGFNITDTSTNGVYINTVDAPLGRGNTAPLADGDTLYMANYIISVMIENDSVEERHGLGLTGPNAVRLGGATRTLPPPLLAQEFLTAHDSTGGLLGVVANVQLDPLMAPANTELSSYSAAEGKPQALVSPQATHPLCLPGDETLANDTGSVEPNLLADIPPRSSSSAIADVHPLGAPLGKLPLVPWSSAAPPLVEPSNPPPRSLLDESCAPSNARPASGIPEDLDLSDLLPGAASARTPLVPSQRENARLDKSNEAPHIVRKTLAPPPTDDLELRDPGSRSRPLGERDLDRLASLKEAAAQRVVAAPELSNATMSRAPLSPAASPSDADELQAFWNALGFNPDLAPPAQRQEFFAELGRAIAEMADGMHSILAAWATVKNECQIGSLRTHAGNDNALQFMKSSHALREALAKDRGFLLLSRSVRAGFDDIKAHEVAAIAAMRGAVSNVLTNMSPQRIESDGANIGLFGARITKAKLWDSFVELHASMISDIDRTARSYIAEEFARSYESQFSAPGQNAGKTA
ncbi:type VI secretion system-associated FHA domain protein [Bradyrhizobium cosmicum]|uniref:type VI secretion system-associated FHA domain protein n=1 Tax=Bradyrhizobium cosmicum TaxID=1404864 RepID=UPI0028F01C3D|nr:type VI secretion system-associated FHA domain protein [Bradyrhizobium cosmicum]